MLFEWLVSILQNTDRQHVRPLQNPGRILLDSGLSLSQKTKDILILFVSKALHASNFENRHRGKGIPDVYDYKYILVYLICKRHFPGGTFMSATMDWHKTRD